MMNTMQNNFDEETPVSAEIGYQNRRAIPLPTVRQPGLITRWMNSLVQMGLGESLLRVGTNLFSIVAILVVVLLAQAYYRQTPGPFSVNRNQDQVPPRPLK